MGKKSKARKEAAKSGAQMPPEAPHRDAVLMRKLSEVQFPVLKQRELEKRRSEAEQAIFEKKQRRAALRAAQNQPWSAPVPATAAANVKRVVGFTNGQLTSQLAADLEKLRQQDLAAKRERDAQTKKAG